MNFFSWKTVPFVRFIVPLILGIVVAVFIGTSTWLYAGMIAFGLLGLLLTIRIRALRARIFIERWSLFFITILLMGLGAFLVDVNSSIDEDDHFSYMRDATFLKGVVDESPQSKKKSSKTILEVEQVMVDTVWYPVQGNLLVYLQKEEAALDLQIGDVLIVPFEQREVEPPANPGEFNYKRFLSFRDIHHQVYVKSGQWAKVNERWSLRRVSESWRRYLRLRLDLIGMSDKEVAIASALLLGKKDELDPELRQSYASAGAMHVLAVSGLHVGIIFLILQLFLSWIDKWKRGPMIKSIIIILALWIYAFVTGLSPSVVRAATMFSAVTLGTGLGRKSSVYNTVASSAFILLVFNPFYIMEVGFQLSYLAVLGIIYLHPKLYALLYFPQWLPDKIWQISCVSIAAQLATFPLGLLYFHQFPTYFLLSNLIVIPAAFLILHVGLFYIALSWVPYLGDWIGELLNILIKALNSGVTLFESLPMSIINGVDISILTTWSLYILVIFFTIALVYRKKVPFFIATSVLAVLMISQVYELFEKKRDTFFVVYNVRGESVLNFVSERENLLLTSDKIKKDESKQQFHLRNNWNIHGAPEPEFLTDSVTGPMRWLSDELFMYKGYSFAHIDDRIDVTDIEPKLEVDFMVLSYHRNLSMQDILETYSPGRIILDGTIRGKTLERIKEDAAEMDIHAVNVDGYFAQRL
ncbi:MAG: ComEC family competence protein [Flavobacteriales bacterium]|nr:ComEC family competence protein [Flavobacteriales bacterium]